MQKLLLVYYHSENRATGQIWKILPNMVFPPIWGEKWRRPEHAHASYPGLFFRPPGFSPYVGREERRVQGLDYVVSNLYPTQTRFDFPLILYDESLPPLFQNSLGIFKGAVSRGFCCFGSILC